jgi:hypothetical protein
VWGAAISAIILNNSHLNTNVLQGVRPRLNLTPSSCHDLPPVGDWWGVQLLGMSWVLLEMWMKKLRTMVWLVMLMMVASFNQLLDVLVEEDVSKREVWKVKLIVAFWNPHEKQF